MKITGQILKENRERKGISITEVAIATKVNNKTLLAIEAGNMDQLPPKTFLRGFVRAYATYLELDVDSVMNTYYEEMGSTRPRADLSDPGETAIDKSASSVNRTKSAPNEANDAINPKASLAVKVGAVAAIFLLVILIVVFKNKMENYEKEALDKSVPGTIAAISTPSAGESPLPIPGGAAAMGGLLAGGGSPTPRPSSTPETKVSAESATAIASQPAARGTVNPTPMPSATPVPTSTPTQTPKPTPDATPSPHPSPTPSSTPAASPSPTPTPKPGRAQEVIIEALDDVEVDVTVDDEGTKKMKLHSEQVQNIKAKRRVVLRFADGGAVNLIVNGVERGVPGDLGKPVRVELP